MKEITIRDIEYIAELARLYLTDEEKKLITPQLKDILSYVEKLNQLDTAGVEPTAHILPLKNVWRSDERKESLDQQHVLDMAPKKKDSMFRVPRIIE